LESGDGVSDNVIGLQPALPASVSALSGGASVGNSVNLETGPQASSVGGGGGGGGCCGCCGSGGVGMVVHKQQGLGQILVRSTIHLVMFRNG
jgi:hypothetical protein